nr:odorant binding protein [Semanotus bifasciatus]
MKCFILVVIFSNLLLTEVKSAMTEKQLIAAVKMVRNVCLPKTKASVEDVDKMHKGDWDVDHTAMCYMHCALNMYKLIDKDNTLNYDSVIIQIKQLPDRYKESTEKCLDPCKNSAVTLDDKCAAAYEISKCLYFCNPGDYYLP